MHNHIQLVDIKVQKKITLKWLFFSMFKICLLIVIDYIFQLLPLHYVRQHKCHSFRWFCIRVKDIDLIKKNTTPSTSVEWKEEARGRVQHIHQLNNPGWNHQQAYFKHWVQLMNFDMPSNYICALHAYHLSQKIMYARIWYDKCFVFKVVQFIIIIIHLEFRCFLLLYILHTHTMCVW